MPTTQAGDIKINYKVDGKGEPIIMIMGFSSPMIGWYFQNKYLSKYFKVYTFDNRGVGESDKPQGPYTTKMMADDTINLMNSLGIEKAHIIGASMGGMIAQELVINNPDRVDKLVLACTTAGQETPRGIAVDMSQKQSSDITREIISLSFNKRHYKIIVGGLSLLSSILSSRHSSVGIEGQIAACVHHNTVDRLREVEAKTLVIVGSKDRLINPISSEILAEKIPNSKLVKLEGGSHTLMVELRNEFNQEVHKFLSNN